MAPTTPLPLSSRPPAAVGVICLHGVLVLLLLQTDLLKRVLPPAPPVSVTLLAAPERALTPSLSTAPLLPKPAPVRLPALPDLMPLPHQPQPPAMPVDARTATTAPAATMATVHGLASEVDALPAPQAAPAPMPATAPAPTPVPEPRRVAPGAISYRVPPAVAVPLASRRLRESGTVWLRVLVDRQGLPVDVTVHRSSGFPRLDEQALAAMQQARFVPQTENGTPIDWVVIAPLAYDID